MSHNKARGVTISCPRMKPVTQHSKDMSMDPRCLRPTIMMGLLRARGRVIDVTTYIPIAMTLSEGTNGCH